MIRIHMSPHRGIQSIACLIAIVAPTVHGAPAGMVSAQTAWATQSAPAVPDSPDQNPGKEPDEPTKTPAPPARQGPPLAPLAKNRKPDPQALRDAGRTGEVTVSVRFTEMRAADTPPADDDVTRRREQLGRLMFARVSLDSDGAPLREVLRKFRRALGVNLLVFERRVHDGEISPGVDGDIPIDLTLEDADGIAVLEALAGIAGMTVGWQLNGNTVEFGPKPILARTEARRTEAMEMGDQALLPPDWFGPRFGNHDIREQLGNESYNRLDSDQVLGDLLRLISTHCEPEAFEPDPERQHSAAPTVHKHVPASGGPGGTRRTRSNPNTNAPHNFNPEVAAIFVHGKWASMQTHGTTLTVVGPDFVLRRIVGYPEPLPPRAPAAAPAAAPAGPARR
jgi:hypothetical protein